MAPVADDRDGPFSNTGGTRFNAEKTMSVFRHLALLAAASSLFLAACGGGSDSGGTAPPPAAGGAEAVPLAQFAAVGSSSRTVNLAWAPSATATTYAVERKAGGGSYAEVALVDGRSGQFLDDGLNKSTAYSYRVVATAGSRATVAESSVTTSDEDAVVTARGAAIGTAATSMIGTAGGRLTSADGQIAIDLPAGALAASTTAELQTVANTAPDGRGDGLHLKLSALPTQPLALTLKVDEATLNDFDGLRIAVQRADGAWFSLPLAAVDKGARTLQAQLPLQLLAPTTALKTVQAAGDISIAFTIVKYLAFSLQPKAARVEVNKSLALVPYARVRGYSTQIGSCERFDDSAEACMLQPVLETRQMVLLNNKAGYTRKWLVNLAEGGSASDGTVAPAGTSGATYTAPAQVPAPDSVRVIFESTNQATGKTLLLSALVTVFDNRWHGSVKTETLPSDAGTWMVAIGRVTWTLDAAASSGSSKVYRPLGTIEMHVFDDDCTVTITPDTQPVSTDTRLVELKIDESKSPAQYTLKLITFWQAEMLGVCPKASTTRTTYMAGYGWELSGDVLPDGRTIEGFEFGPEGERIDWSFTR